YIDAGHGGSDPGAVANGLKEKDLTLSISKKIASILKDYDCTVKLSRTTDRSLTLKQRTDDANRWGADYLLSIHINAGGGTGYEDFIYNGLSNTSKAAKLRDTIHAEVVKELKVWRNRGKKKANFHMVRESKMPAMLSENGFIDNKEDADRLKSDAFLNKIAKGHANGLIKALKLKKKGASSTKPVTNTKAPKPSNNASKPNKSTYTGDSVVDYLKHNNQPSSFAHRKKLAQQYGIKNYAGTAAQNTRLLNALRGGKTTATSTKKYTPKSYKVGSKVKIKSSAKTYSRSTAAIPARYKNKTYTIQQASKNDVLIKELYSWVNKNDTY